MYVGEKGEQGGKKKEMQIFLLKMVTDDLLLRQPNPVPEIITHSDEEVNEIDLNVLRGEGPAAGGRCILHAKEIYVIC